MMRTEEPRPIRLKDYRAPDWLIETVELDVALDPTATIVRSKLRIKPNGAATPAPLAASTAAAAAISPATRAQSPAAAGAASSFKGQPAQHAPG